MAEAFLLDTSMVSEFAPDRPPMPSKVAAWVAAREARFHIATVTLAEISEGIAQVRRAGGHRRADALEGWLDDLIERYDYRTISFDIGIARVAGRMADTATAEGVNPGLADVFIGASAKARNMTVVTRNMRHFTALHVDCIDPFESR